jgi:hypothetical protein
LAQCHVAVYVGKRSAVADLWVGGGGR